jgi:hypothetical protein
MAAFLSEASRMRTCGLSVAALLVHAAWAAGAHAAAPLEHGFGAMAAGPQDHISDSQRARMWQAIDAQVARLGLRKAGERPAFIWPLRAARGFAQPAVDRVSYYVDHDAAAGRLLDYHCGSRTYDRQSGYNHQGIDISIWPDSWNMMQTGQLEIIAAAPGTIVFKADGHFDRNCTFGSDDWNAVSVRHDDGSVAWYGHMKSGSLTAKPVGARVAAGEFLGNIGSSGVSTGPHLHFEVYDADRRLVDPYQGACNAKNPDSWWAQQPAYAITRLNRLITASAAPVFSTCGADGRLQDPGTLSAKSDFAPGETAYFVAFVRDAQAGDTVRFNIRRPDGTVWRTFTSTPASQFFSGAYWWASYTMPATEPAGTWMVEADVAGTSSSAPFTLTAGGRGIPNYTDLWWNPAEAGWGVNLNHQGETLFATWFTYDSDGAGMWLVVPEAVGSGSRMSGAIYRATGVPLPQIDGAPAADFPLPSVGTGTFDFIDAGRLTFTYTLGGVTQVKTLQRQPISTATRCVETRGTRTYATNYQDLWWNPPEPGWGINLAHQGEIIFATWFTYGATGRGQWLVGSELRRQATGEFRGRLYRTSGQPFDRIDGAPAMTGSPADVGEMTITFTNGESGRIDYVVDGVAQSKPITRQLFGATAPLCQ